MAGRIYLQLHINGNLVPGNSTVTTIGGVDVSQHIECIDYTESARTEQQPGSTAPTGTRSYSPIVIVKDLDKSTPLLSQALARTAPVEAWFRFFRPIAGTDDAEQFHEVHVNNARICELKRYIPEGMGDPMGSNSGDLARSPRPIQESVSIIYSWIHWDFKAGGTAHTDDWTQQ